MRKLFKGFWRDERGQALPFFTVFSLIMAMTIIMNYNFGQTVSERMRAQCVADAAAYTAAAWQARFLNYCAYTRRAIIANYCNIASMNVMYSNRRMFKTIGDESWFATDEDDGKEKEDDGMIASTAEMISTMMNISREMVESLDMREMAEEMNKIMSNSQAILYQCVVDPEVMMKDIAKQSGQSGWEEEFELNKLNLTPAIPFMWENASINELINPNMEMDAMLERRSIPIDEIRWQFDRYTLPLLPTNGKGYGPIAGRKWEMNWYSCCANEPFYMDVRIKWAKPQVPKDPFQSKMGLIRPYADIMDNREETSRDRSQGNYITSHEGKGKHRAEPDDKKFFGAYCFYVKKCDKEYCFPEVFYDLYSGSSTKPYDLMYRISEDMDVYEVKEDLEDKYMEPSVYCAIRRRADQIGYLRLLMLENPHDILVLSRAKLNFVSPDENLTSNRMSEPNLNYPFWTAKLAPIDDGRNASTIRLRLALWEQYFVDSTTGVYPKTLHY